MSIKELISPGVGALQKNIDLFVEKYIRLWESTGTDFPEINSVYSTTTKRKTEKQVSALFEQISGRIDKFPEETGQQKKWAYGLQKNIKKYGNSALKLANLNLDIFFSEGFIRSTKSFVNDVRDFEDGLPLEELYQAIRNVWIMNTLQVSMGMEVNSSPSIFAYSMLYPYTDNYNDSTIHTKNDKFKYNIKLKKWLEGDNDGYGNEYEKKTRDLVKLIEKQFPRDMYPGVHQSVLAIYNAQIKSMSQHKGNGNNGIDLMRISFEKGGTSVLADGFLTDGNIDINRQMFCFGFGAFLQLIDDIQDIKDDVLNGHRTFFSEYAGKYQLDKQANKLINFMSAVLEYNRTSGNTNNKALDEVITKSCTLIILEAISRNRKCFSRRYVKKMEKHFPVRFSYFSKLMKVMEEWRDKVSEQAVPLDKAFSLLLSSEDEFQPVSSEYAEAV